MKLKCRQYGNSWVVTIPAAWKKPEFVHIYDEEQLSDSEMLKRLSKKVIL